MQKNNIPRRNLILFSILSSLVLLTLVFIGIQFGWVWTIDQTLANSATQKKQTEAKAQKTLAATKQSEEKAQTALARQLSAQAQLLFGLDKSKQMRAVLLAIESMRLSPSSEAAQILQNNLLAYPVSKIQHQAGVNGVVFSPNGKYLITMGSYDNTVIVSEVETGHEVSRMKYNFSVWALDVSPDGKYVVSGSDDRTARVWEIDTGREIARASYVAVVDYAVFSPDGKYVLVHHGDAIGMANGDNTAIWEALTGKEVSLVPGDEVPVAFSPNGKHILSATRPYAKDYHPPVIRDIATGEKIAELDIAHLSTRTLKFSVDGKYLTGMGCPMTSDAKCFQVATIWDALTGKQVTTWAHDNDQFLVFSPDLRYVVSTDAYNTIRIWELSTGREVSRLIYTSKVNSIVFSPNGRYVASLSEDGAARVWDTLTGKEIADMTERWGVSIITFSPDGKYLATGGGGMMGHSYSHVWKLDATHEIKHIQQPGGISIFAVSPNGQYVATSSNKNVIHIRETATGAEITSIKQKYGLSAFAFSPDGKFIVTGSYNEPLHILETETGKEVVSIPYIRSLESNREGVKFVAFSPDGKLVLSYSEDHTARVWDAVTGKEINRIIHAGGITFAAFSPNSQYVVTGGCDQAIPDVGCKRSAARVSDALTGKEIAHMEHGYIENAIAFSPDSRYVVSGGDKELRVWDTLTGKEIFRAAQPEFMLAVRFSPDGKQILASSGNHLSLLEPATRREILLKEGEAFRSIAFSPDGRYVIGANVDWQGSIRIWETATGREVGQVAYNMVANQMIFGPDSKYLIFAKDKAINIQLWRPEDLIADACSRAVLNLTRAQWQQYIGDALPYQMTCPGLPTEDGP